MKPDEIASTPMRSGPTAAIRRTDCGDFGIRIARDGTWWHDGTPFTRLPLVKLFASVLQREEDGTYWLVTPVERGRITVDDAPFVAVELTVGGSGAAQVLTFRTNIDDIVTADADHPLRVTRDPATGAPDPYILVRGNLEARLNRPVFYQLVELGLMGEGEESKTFGVWSKGQFFQIGTLDEIQEEHLDNKSPAGETR